MVLQVDPPIFVGMKCFQDSIAVVESAQQVSSSLHEAFANSNASTSSQEVLQGQRYICFAQPLNSARSFTDGELVEGLLAIFYTAEPLAIRERIVKL